MISQFIFAVILRIKVVFRGAIAGFQTLRVYVGLGLIVWFAES